MIARWPRSIAAASCAAEDTLTKSSMPMSVKALAASDERAVGDDGDIHARRRLQHLVDESAPGEPGADHAQSYRIAGVLTGPQGLVDDDHDELLSSRRSAQLMSFSETMTPSVIGQSIPRAGSSQRMPVSAPGVYGDETP